MIPHQYGNMACGKKVADGLRRFRKSGNRDVCPDDKAGRRGENSKKGRACRNGMKQQQDRHKKGGSGYGSEKYGAVGTEHILYFHMEISHGKQNEKSCRQETGTHKKRTDPSGQEIG